MLAFWPPAGEDGLSLAALVAADCGDRRAVIVGFGVEVNQADYHGAAPNDQAPAVRSARMTAVFLSYARGDHQAFVARVYEFLQAHGFALWWDRKSMPARALAFTEEIRDAIHRSDLSAASRCVQRA